MDSDERTQPPHLEVVPQVDAGGHAAEPADDDDGSDEPLSASELRFADMVASGDSLESAAKVLKVTSRTLRRWRKRPAVVDAIRNRVTENLAQTRAILAAGSSRAGRALVAMADGSEPAESPRVSAARAVVEGASRLVEIEELASRLAELELRLGQQPGGAGLRRM